MAQSRVSAGEIKQSKAQDGSEAEPAEKLAACDSTDLDEEEITKGQRRVALRAWPKGKKESHGSSIAVKAQMSKASIGNMHA